MGENSLATRATSAPVSISNLAHVPALRLDESKDDLVRQFGLHLEGSVSVIKRGPSMVERQILQKRNVALMQVLQPISASREATALAKALLAQFFKGYPSLLNQDGGSLISAYMVDMESLPLFAVARAVLDIKQGRVKIRDQRTGREMDIDPDWPPSSSRIAEVARRFVNEPAKEQYNISRVLTAKRIEPPMVTDPKRRAAIGEMLSGLAQTLRANDAEREARLKESP